ncbi:Cap protein [bat associated cyclovirus 5]|uniref:Cap protein n=1 Tax=bat associated cyclovirus 5 TaxID=2050925 RepID=E9NWS9_9CIRC|nr:Cap protein [Cyclovirus bat/USA/2009]ADU77000.1 Cap protein [Cyclovirus bat/USA/2009]
MVRLRRFFRRFRRPLRAVRRMRRYFPNRRRKVRSRRGSMFCKLTKVATITVENNINSVWDGSFVPDDFKEFTSLSKNFEFVRFLKVRITVVPLQNVANNSTSSVPAFAMTPWHYAMDLPKNFQNYLSMDKSKMSRQTHVMSQTYVPNIGLLTSVLDHSGKVAEDVDAIQWRPYVRTVNQNGNSLPRVRCGVVAFQGQSDMAGRTTTFNIKTDVFVRFTGQSIMNI